MKKFFFPPEYSTRRSDVHAKGGPVSRVLCPRSRREAGLGDHHSSRTAITHGLKQPTRKPRPGRPWRFPIWSCSGRGFPSLPRHRGNWWALTPPFHPYPPHEAEGGLLSVALSGDCSPWALPSTLPFGARTFLPAHPANRPRAAMIRPAFGLDVAAILYPAVQSLSINKWSAQTAYLFMTNVSSPWGLK